MNSIASTCAAMAVVLGACSQAPEPASPSVITEATRVIDPDNECKASGAYGFVCGPQNAEDLVLIPGTPWIIASGMAQGAAIYLVDSEQKTWTNLYPANAARAAWEAMAA